MLFAGRPFGIIVGTARRNVCLISLVLSARPKNGRSATRPHPNRSRWGGRTIAKYVLAADFTLMTDYRNVPLATFFSCIPTDQWQSRLVFRILANAPKVDAQGRPIRVPYGLRKIEASLVQANGRDSVVIADPRNIEQYIGDDTEVVGLHSMDPLGLGPVSMSFTMGGVLTPYTKAMFLDLVGRLQRPDRKYKIVLGGPGGWHFDCREGMQQELGIDHIVHGEVDHLVPEIFERIAGGEAPPVMRFTNATAPTIDQIPKILGPTKWIGIQSGIETGSPALSRAVLHRKAAPFDAEEWPDLVVRGTEILNRNYWYPAYTIILGLPGETPEDAWMTVDLIDRMEQIPNGHFVTAPLTFVPIGVLRGEQFYNLDEMIDEARFNVAYRAWRHILLEVDKDLWRLTTLPLPLRAMIVLTARLGGRYILDIMHRFARSKGFRVRAPAKSRRQAEGHTVSFPAA